MGIVKIKKYLIVGLFFTISQLAFAQKLDWQKQIDYEQNRIDMSDGDLDSAVIIGSATQNAFAFKVYFTLIDQTQELIKTLDVKAQETHARALFEIIKRIEKQNVPHVSANQKVVLLSQKLITLNNPTKELEQIKNDVKTGIQISDLINLKPYAKDYWAYAAKFYPFDVLNKFKVLAYTPLGTDVITKVAKIDPSTIKQYLGSNHMIDRTIKNSQDSVVLVIKNIQNTYGTQSKSYALLDPIFNKKLTYQKAETISKDEQLFYKQLIELRKQKNILAEYTVDNELENLAMQRVLEINLRHDDNEQHRFAPINNDNAYEIYTTIVYSEEEIFTSSFLGMYKRMNEKRKEKSGYEFLQQLNFNKFRVFLKQCAGYNKIDDFMGTMNDSQQNALIALFASGLYNYGGDLGPAVDVADTYGSLENETIKAIFIKTIKKELRKCITENNEHGIKIYGLLLKLTGGNPNEFTDLFGFNIPALDKVNSADLFIDDKHIQQHFFFDDEDGLTAYNHWLGLYPASIYKREDKGNYVLIKSISGKNLEIYANKPQTEISGREDLKKLFESTGRFPDLVVHRGHSYYIENTLENMSNSNKVAILGSCGGYQNISKAMENAMDVQIVSTKQVGTLVVNSVLIQEITEVIRSGKDIIWIDLWKQVSTKLQNNPQFKEYIPPYKNLGAKFIKAYTDL
jgi:hypothetical protein